MRHKRTAAMLCSTVSLFLGLTLAVGQPPSTPAVSAQTKPASGVPKPVTGVAVSPVIWDTVIFDVVAHEDDWQLFMNPNVYNEISVPKNKTVIIYTTAGDAGNKAGNNDRPYYRAREEGANRSVRFIADSVDMVRPGMQESVGTFNGHPIKKVVYKNTVSYFLRLPDGGVDGVGIPAGINSPTITKLYNGETQSLPAVDKSTTYTSRIDLKNTLEDIVRSEVMGAGAAKFNLIDPDPATNHSDHVEHRHTTKFMQDVQLDMPCIDMVYFESYITTSMDVNVTGEDLLNDAATFGVMVSGQSDYGYESTWNVRHKGWLARNYFRTVPAAQPGNGCF